METKNKKATTDGVATIELSKATATFMEAMRMARTAMDKANEAIEEWTSGNAERYDEISEGIFLRYAPFRDAIWEAMTQHMQERAYAHGTGEKPFERL